MDISDQQGPSLAPIALAIAFVGVVIALSLYFALKPQAERIVNFDGKEIAVTPLSENDHILGNPAAPVTIITYMDLDCRGCREHHATMKALMAAYGESGDIAWAFRHLPIAEDHPNAPRLAEATECAAEIGGNDAFWKLVNGIYTAPNLNDIFDTDSLPSVALIAGLSSNEFTDCLNSGKHKSTVQRSFDEGLEAGADGAPYSVVLIRGDAPIPLPGVPSITVMRAIVENAIAATLITPEG